jgi:hypothetical protein
MGRSDVIKQQHGLFGVWHSTNRAKSAGTEKAIRGALNKIRAREAGIGTDSSHGDYERALELKPISAGVEDAGENGDSRADEERNIPDRTALKEVGRWGLRAQPIAREAGNEYAKHLATTEAQRQGRAREKAKTH